MTENQKQRMQKIKEGVAKKRTSIAAICKIAGVSETMWQHWRYDRHEPRDSSLTKLEQALKGIK